MATEQLIIGVAVLGLLIAVFDGMGRNVALGLGALVVLAYPFVEAYFLAGQTPWTLAFDGKPPFLLVDAALRVGAAFLLPYAVVRTLFSFVRSWSA